MSYLGFSERHLSDLWLDGVQLKNSMEVPCGWSFASALEFGEAADYTDRASLKRSDATQAVTAPRIELQFDLQVKTLAQLQTLQRAAARSAAGGTCALWWGAWHMDIWPLDVVGQTTWNTWRATPYAIPGVVRSEQPPSAWVESTAGVLTPLTVVETASPASGSVYVPGGSIPFALESNADLVASATGGYLQLWYPIMVIGRIELSHSIRQTLNMTCRIEFREAR